MEDGTAIDLVTLSNDQGMEAKVSSYGAILTALTVPDREGRGADVVLGFDRLEDYLKGHPYFGTTTGRVANRIAGGVFELNGTTYNLAKNNGPNHLHGGDVGLDKKAWNAVAESSTGTGPVSVALTHLSPDGDEGYPGNLDLKVVYSLTADNELRIDYEATTDQPTPVNLTNHSYFNFSDPGRHDILDHELTLNADHYTPVDETSIPTGEIRAVAGTVMDFREPTRIGDRIEKLEGDPGGYDHNYVLNQATPGTLSLAARVRDPKSGRVMEIHTTEPGIQLYTANYLDGSLTGKGGAVYAKRHAFCLETQHFPDSVHHPGFPPIILQPGETYRQTTVHRFLTDRKP